MVRIDNIDSEQGKAIGYLVAISIILSGVVGVLAYLQSKKHAKINEEVLNLDKEIKMLEANTGMDEATRNERIDQRKRMINTLAAKAEKIYRDKM